MPPELAGPLPRRIRPSDSSRYGEIVIALMLGFTAILILWICKSAVQQMQHRSTLRQAGVEVLGKITRIEPVARSMDIVSYSFVVKGWTFSGKAGVPARVERNLHESGPLMVRYLPSDPTINHPAAWEWPLSSFLLGIIPLLISTSLLILFPVLAYRKRQLLALGKPAVAVVTGCAPGKASFSLKYEFSTETGNPQKGRGWSGIRREIGARIWILYLPQNPGRNLPYPLPDCRVER
jgi:hypothetical protein